MPHICLSKLLISDSFFFFFLGLLEGCRGSSSLSRRCPLLDIRFLIGPLASTFLSEEHSKCQMLAPWNNLLIKESCNIFLTTKVEITSVFFSFLFLFTKSKPFYSGVTQTEIYCIQMQTLIRIIFRPVNVLIYNIKVKINYSLELKRLKKYIFVKGESNGT